MDVVDVMKVAGFWERNKKMRVWEMLKWYSGIHGQLDVVCGRPFGCRVEICEDNSIKGILA